MLPSIVRYTSISPPVVAVCDAGKSPQRKVQKPSNAATTRNYLMQYTNSCCAYRLPRRRSSRCVSRGFCIIAMTIERRCRRRRRKHKEDESRCTKANIVSLACAVHSGSLLRKQQQQFAYLLHTNTHTHLH